MMSNVRAFVPAALLGIGVLMINGMREQFTMPPREPIASVSREFAGLKGDDVAIAEEERRVAGMSDYVMRNFLRDSVSSFSVYVGYYDRQVKGKTIHSPKNCLPGAGWDILSSAEVVMPDAPSLGRVNRVVLANQGARALVYYWYQGRGRIESNEYKVKWNLLRDAALFGRTEEALVRIVVPIEPAAGGAAGDLNVGIDAADIVAKRVASRLASEVARVMPTAPSA